MALLDGGGRGRGERQDDDCGRFHSVGGAVERPQLLSLSQSFSSCHSMENGNASRLPRQLMHFCVKPVRASQGHREQVERSPWRFIGHIGSCQAKP